jgi:hypothetical protein
LYEFVGTGLIIKAKTGIVWTNQAGGVSCLQPECEGLFVPYGNDLSFDGKLISLESTLFEVFQKADEQTWVQLFERALASYAAAHWAPFREIELDRSRLRDSVEAWVHVIYRPTPESYPPLVEGLGEPPFEAVLTWSNSD